MSQNYNYRSFKPEFYDFSSFDGPRPGHPAVDFTATDLNGNRKKLSDFFGRWIVLETGSITCPIYESKIQPMNELAARFPDVEFLVLYVREAHPGENINQHGTLEEKFVCARRARDEDKEKRTILVDDLEGNAHKIYGGMPNSVYVIDPAGKVVFRGDWNSIKAVRSVLMEGGSGKAYLKERYSARPYFGGGKPNMFDTLLRAGKKATWDFIKAFPKMALKHIRKPG